MALPRLSKYTSLSSACPASDSCDRFTLFSQHLSFPTSSGWPDKLEVRVPFMLPTLPSSAFLWFTQLPHAPPSIFPLYPAPLQHLASFGSWCGSSTTFTAKETSPAHSQTFLKYSVLFVGVLRGGPVNVTPWF